MSDKSSLKKDHPDFSPGTWLQKNRFKVLKLAGQGTFGTVYKCYDYKYQEVIAIKVIRAGKRYTDTAHLEFDILTEINNADPEFKSLCVRLYRKFTVQNGDLNHLCLGFERLGSSLYGFLKRNHYQGFLLHHVQQMAYQLFHALAFCHSRYLIHTDLKPDNVLLVSSKATRLYSDFIAPKNLEIRLIDFGNAVWEKPGHGPRKTLINTRQYRGPEVILGLPWSFPSDLWSAGCTLAELCTGRLLFHTHENLEHLHLMSRVLEQPVPAKMIEQALVGHSFTSSTATKTKFGTMHQNQQTRPGSTETQRSLYHQESKTETKRGTPLTLIETKHHVNPHVYAQHGCHGPQTLHLHPSHKQEEEQNVDQKQSSGTRAATKPSKIKLSTRRGSSKVETTILEMVMVEDGFKLRPITNPESLKHVERQHLLRDLISHPLLLDLLQRTLDFDPHTRLTAAQALVHPFFNDLSPQFKAHFRMPAAAAAAN